MTGGSWFPVPAWLLYGNPSWRDLTTTAKVMLLCCISQANFYQGRFFRSNPDWRVRLAKYPNIIDRNTLNRAQKQLIVPRWLSINPGRRAGDRSRATEYLVPPTLWRPRDIEGHWIQMPRFMFDEILYALDRDAILAYTYLSAAYWRNRDRHDRHEFFVQLGEMQLETGLRDFPGVIQRLYNDWKFKNGVRLFEVTGHRKLAFREWSIGDERTNAVCDAKREENLRFRAQQLIGKARDLELEGRRA